MIRRFFVVVSAAVLFAGGVTLSRALAIDLTVQWESSAPNPETEYVPTYDRAGGQQLLMIYIGSSQCVWSTRDPLPDSVERIKLRLATHARERGISFKAVGVALDWNPKLGLKHLREFGLFDEVSSGYSWGNSLALEYMWTETTVAPRTPQIVVYERDFFVPEDSTDVMLYEVRSRRLLLVLSGLKEITGWADSETPLTMRPLSQLRDPDLEEAM